MSRVLSPSVTCSCCGHEQELEALDRPAVAVPATEAAPAPSRAVPEVVNMTCPFCKGTGRCSKCEGEGMRIGRRRWFGLRAKAMCGVCAGSCECELCGGQGQLPG